MIGRDPFVSICRKKNPYLKTKRSLSDYLGAKHISIDVPTGTTTVINQTLSQRKLGQRDIQAKVGNFMSPLFLSRDSNFILTCPESLAKSYQSLAELEVSEVPIRLQSIEIKMVWHERPQADLLHRWLRSHLAEK